MGENTPIDRSDFFKMIFKKTAEAAAQFVDGYTEPLKKAGMAAQRTFNDPLLAVTEYDNKAKLVSSSKPPVYLLGEVGKNLTAVKALCEKDGFMLTYMPYDQVLMCMMCGERHPVEFAEDGVKTGLSTLTVAVADGMIYLDKHGLGIF